MTSVTRPVQLVLIGWPAGGPAAAAHGCTSPLVGSRETKPPVPGEAASTLLKLPPANTRVPSVETSRASTRGENVVVPCGGHVVSTGLKAGLRAPVAALTEAMFACAVPRTVLKSPPR